jgi:protocatechuate 3,4-dioxygenase beta subunit
VFSPHRVALLIAFTAAFGVSVGAQSRGQGQQQPPRDPSARAAQPTGTASISGQVADLETGRPLKRARVSVTGQGLPQGSSATTDESGRYRVAGLPAGRYTINVSRTGYIGVSYGQRRPMRTGKPLPLSDGQQAKDIDFRLPRGSVITGRILDEDGEPLLFASVRAMRYQYQQGQQRLTAAGQAQTDDRGQYRVFGLAPGNYYVSATGRPEGAPGQAFVSYSGGTGAGDMVVSFSGVSEGGRGMGDGGASPQGYAPTYYPGVPNVSDALMVPVNLCQEVTNVDIQLQLVTTARISGTVVGTDGSAAANSTVMLVPEDSRTAGSGIGSYAARTMPDGSFTLSGVPPGRYVAVARGQSARSSQALFARQTLPVAGQDLMGVTLALAPGASLSGTVTFESSETPAPTDLSQVRITTTPLTPLPGDNGETARAAATGTFTLPNVGSSPQLIRAAGPARPWSLKGVYLNGRDISDLAVEFKSGERVTGLSVVFTDRTTEITGTVPDSSNQLLTDYLVVAFPADQALWVAQSRRIQTSRPDQNGAYRVRGLPAGDYLVIAIDDAEQGQWYDPAFLDQLRASAVHVSLSDGETKSQSLKLVALDR